MVKIFLLINVVLPAILVFQTIYQANYQKMDIVLHQKQIHMTTADMAKVGIKQYEFRFVYRYLLLALYNNGVKNNKDALMEYIKDHRQQIRKFIESGEIN